MFANPGKEPTYLECNGASVKYSETQKAIRMCKICTASRAIATSHEEVRIHRNFKLEKPQNWDQGLKIIRLDFWCVIAQNRP